ncbi:MAG: hypothetical protein A3C71_01450 [Candidatus Yanofskybacteria bacterium RIFCSPHIGHO2_02_FULL_43_15c]|uniref:Galactose-1-phosphate uridyl transferase N-terminal domain-containing protein n=1 Tax=Candidatus Yanofskybacteria bacterium RIFCSPHIGHO2_02_FULL_43_15c TaxID=1802679 RepID=A0A1F8FM58_9BACT|nr:MAG: hypothetical protein A3C71_01450 [Candidatus Yanofskybacteria bacterium RIFCSPHIGHO2_02_FULL_43_15c]
MSDLNEFRQDLVSGDWVLFAAARSKRPHAMEKNNPAENNSKPEGQCPFDDPRASGQEVISEYKKNNGELWITVMTNKYPTVTPGVCLPIDQEGPFSKTAANGFHDVLATKDHVRALPDFSIEETAILLRAYRERYLEIAKHECGEYIQIFHNHGKKAGASVAHPHSQIMSTPILPPVVARSINGSARFFQRNKKKVHDVIIAWEVEQKKRVVFEDDLFIAFCPFSSKRPYEVRIFPKISNARFETTDEKGLTGCAEALNYCLGQLKKVLNHDLNFNFFIHTAPVRETNQLPCADFYHWHLEVLPHYSTLAGFDFSTGIIVNVIDPDKAAEEIRNA